MNTRLVLLLTILLFSNISCETKENNPKTICGYNDPVHELPWLRDRIAALETDMGPAGYQIIRYQYHGAYVFLIDPCYGCADDLISVYNCDGDVICEFGGIAGQNTCPDFETAATDSTMLINAVNP